MAPDLARTVLIAIAATGAVTWLIALRFLINSFSSKEAPGQKRMDRLDPETRRIGEVLQGSALVEGRPADLSAKAATILVKERNGPLGWMKILERSGDRIRFEGAGGPAGSQNVCRVGRGELQFTASGGDRTEVRYRVELAGGRWLLWLGMLFQTLGAAALVVGFWALNQFAVEHPDAGVRGQVFQMFHAVHFLWPPFLVGGLYRFGRSSLRARCDTLIHNLPFYEE